jgi:hypothetical protein
VPASIGAQIGYAEAQIVRGYLDDANSQYQKIVDGVTRTGSTTISNMLGWCYLRLQRREGLRRIVRSLSIDRSVHRVDIGLALLCEGATRSLSTSTTRRGAHPRRPTRAISGPPCVKRGATERIQSNWTAGWLPSTRSAAADRYGEQA